MKRQIRLALLSSSVALGYDWKLDGDTLAKDDAGNPIWIADGGSEMSVKGDTISRLNGEAATHRKRAETAEVSLAKFEGIKDPEAAKKALETVSKLDQKQLIDAGKVDEVRAEITKQYEQKLSEKDQALEQSNQRINNMQLDTAFNSSEFARERLAVPVEMVRATFGDRFKIEDGKIVAYGADGNPVYSKKHVGEPADFDEALELIVGNYKHKDTILKAPDAGGTGGNGGGGARGRGRTITKADFQEIAQSDPVKAQEISGKVGSGEMTMID